MPKTLYLGIALILACEILLFLDVHRSSRGVIKSNVDANAAITLEPPDPLSRITAWVAINMTPLAWLGYVLFLDGAITLQRGISPFRHRPHHLATCALASIIIWCVFDIINFYCFKPPAWFYIGVSLPWPQRFAGYTIAFAAEFPAMFLTAQFLLNTRLLDRFHARPFKLPPILAILISLTGLAMLAWPIFSGSAKANYTLWTSLVLLLDPINLFLGRPSMLRDWQNGWYGRTIALLTAGLLCGLLWEFWNYWALAKWIYNLPFLGHAQCYHYFEMPLPGLLGFIPFGMECWVTWQALRILLDGIIEPLPSSRDVI